MSTWVGLGGWRYTGSDNVLQIGIKQFTGKVDGKSQPSIAYAWYQWWWLDAPGGKDPPYGEEVQISSFDVQPGDQVTAAVHYSGGKSGQVELMNWRTNKKYTKLVAKPKNATLPGNSAEWIVEDPGGTSGYAALAKWWPAVVFTNAFAGNLDVSPPLLTDPSLGTVENILSSSSHPKPLTSVSPGVLAVQISSIG
jgi:hypothetical protein